MPIFNFLASLCSWPGWFESGFVGNPEGRFFRDEAHFMLLHFILSPSSAMGGAVILVSLNVIKLYITKLYSLSSKKSLNHVPFTISILSCIQYFLNFRNS